jgi:hypothetical protein
LNSATRVGRVTSKAGERISLSSAGQETAFPALLLPTSNLPQNARLSRQRLDFFHKASLKLIRLFDRGAFEDLLIKVMVENRGLAEAIGDVV